MINDDPGTNSSLIKSIASWGKVTRSSACWAVEGWRNSAGLRGVGSCFFTDCLLLLLLLPVWAAAAWGCSDGGIVIAFQRMRLPLSSTSMAVKTWVPIG